MFRLMCAPLFACLFAVPSLAAGPYENLLKYVPPQSNTLFLVNVKAAYDSPLARAEKWSENTYQRYKSGLSFVPPDASQVIIASQINLSNMTRDHQVGLIRVMTFPTMKSLAEKEGGSTDSINGQGVALSPRNMYLTALEGPAIALVYPADRQAMSRWLRHCAACKEAEFPRYLRKAADEAGDSVLAVAVDLTDSVDPTLLAMGLAISPVVVKAKGTDVQRLAKFVASIQGLTFTTKVTDSITGTIRLDFGFEITAHKSIARDLFLELLGDQGVAMSGMESWQVKFTDTSMTMTGPMSTADVRHVISLFAFPSMGAQDQAKIAVSGPATKRYLAAVDTLLGDLSAKKDSPDYLKTATWHEKAATQIEQLSRMGADPIAVEAAIGAAKRIRAIGATLRGVPVDIKEIDSKAYYYSQPNYGVSFGWWGGFRPMVTYNPGGGGVQTNLPQVYAERAKTVADSDRQRTDLSIQIGQIMGDAKRKLSEKYKIQF
jgi:hypothetical protein